MNIYVHVTKLVFLSTRINLHFTTNFYLDSILLVPVPLQDQVQTN